MDINWTAILCADTRTITYTRNELGDLTGVSDSTVGGGSPMYTFVYDELNRVAEARAQFVPGGVRVLASQYDRRGFRDLMRWTGDGAARDHALAVDAQGRVTDATLPGNQAFGFEYYANDFVKDVTRTSGTATHYTYEPTGALKAASVAHAQNTIETLAYYYTPSGQISARSDHEGTHSYGYTPTYRLSEVQNPSSSLLPASETFTYDAVGNRTNVSGVSSYNPNNQMIGANIAFDANGNLTSKPGATFAWDMKNCLQTFSTGGDTQASYTYDPFGRRIKKTVTTGSTTTMTYFLWDGDQMIAEYDGSGALTKRYAYLGGYAPAQMATIDPQTQQETIYDVHADHLDTPKFLTNQAGQVVWRARHEAYGEAIVNENPDGDSTSVTFNFRFPGQYFDAESNLHYNRYRYYDTVMGRYISADPIGQKGGTNLYLYVAGNPAAAADFYGLVTWSGSATSVGAALIVGAMGMVMEVTSECACGYRVHATIWVAGGMIGAGWPLRSVAAASHGSTSLDDGFPCPDPMNFNGPVGLGTAQGTSLPLPVSPGSPPPPSGLQPNSFNPGAPGIGVSVTTGMVGNAFAPPQIGIIAGFGVGGGVVGGRAVVVDYYFEQCCTAGK